MRKFLALASTLLLCAAAGSPPPMYNAVAGQIGGYQMQAARQNIMTTQHGNLNPLDTTPAYATLSTYVTVTPLEAQAYGVRLTFAQPYATTMQIVSAWIYPSDSYAASEISGYSANGAAFGSLQGTVIPTINSVYATCTTVNTSTSVTCSGGTGSFPSTSTMYVIGPGVPARATATIADSTHITLSAAATASATVTLHMANSNQSAGCQIFFDNKGADVDTINNAGSTSTISFSDPTSPNTNPQAFTLQYSDFVPCLINTPRADGGSGYIMMAYVTVGPNTTHYGHFGSTGLDTYNSQIAPLFGKREHWAHVAWTGNTDWANNVTGSGFKAAVGFSPVGAIQYFTDAVGWNVLQVGDSHSTAPTNDVFSTPIYRACKTISTPLAPCEHANIAWGGQNWSVYGEALRRNIAGLKPSVLIGQPISRNETGGLTQQNFSMLLSRLLSYGTAAARNGTVRVGIQNATPLPGNIDGNSTVISAVTTMRNRINALAVGCSPSSGGQLCPTVPVFDPSAYLGRGSVGGNFYDYIAVQFNTSASAAAGATTISVASYVTPPCQVGDILTDLTTPSAIAAGATVQSNTSTTVTVLNTAIIGPGIGNGDTIQCSAPGYSGVAVSDDAIHPNYGGVLAEQAGANTFLRQLLGLQ